MGEIKLISTKDISKHSTGTDCWIVVDGQVWDVTDFLEMHPGGAAVILKYAGRDATKAYAEVHAPSVIKSNLTREKLKGVLDGSTIDAEWQKQPVTENSRVLLDSKKPPLYTLINAKDFEIVGSKTATEKTWAFYSSAASDLITRDANKLSFDRIWFRPRTLRNVREVDARTSFLGINMKIPLFVSPAAMAKMIHPDGERAIARACENKGIIQGISNNSSFPLEEIVKAAPNVNLFFQLYVNRDREKSARLLKRISAIRQVKAVFVTVDAAWPGKREADERLKADENITVPMSPSTAKNDKHGGGLGRVMAGYIDPGLTWEDLAWIRKHTHLPLCLKGVMSADDAILAMEAGIDGILISNHGGRNLDTSPPSIVTLLECHRRCPEIFDKMEVFIDGGIRRGSDILKAICLGATAVGMGRSMLFAANYGQEGVEHLIDIMQDELETAMRNNGITTLAQATPDLVHTADIDHLVPTQHAHPYARAVTRKPVHSKL